MKAVFSVWRVRNSSMGMLKVRRLEFALAFDWPIFAPEFFMLLALGTVSVIVILPFCMSSASSWP